MIQFNKGSEKVRFVFLEYHSSCSVERMVWQEAREDLGRSVADD